MRALTILVVLISLVFHCTSSGECSGKKGTPEQQRQGLLKRNQEILNNLYKTKPEAKEAVEKAYGYATFSDFGIKIFIAGGGKGRGVAINNQTGEKTFMRMKEIQAGLGFGIKKFMQVWVFEDRKAFDTFAKSGWNFGGEGTVAAKSGFSGKSYQGAVSVSPGVWLYQMTEKGLALEIAIKGTRYRKDDALNNVQPGPQQPDKGTQPKE